MGRQTTATDHENQLRYHSQGRHAAQLGHLDANLVRYDAFLKAMLQG